MTPALPRTDRRTALDLPAALATLAACAEIRGAALEARALAEARALLEPLPPAERLRLIRRLRRGGGPSDPFAPLAASALRRVLVEGSAAVVRAETRRMPRDLARLLEMSGIRPELVLDAYRRHGAVSAADFAAICLEAADSPDEHSASTGRGLANALPALRAGWPRIPLGRAWAIVDELQAGIDARRADGLALTPVGSLRRFEPTVGDIELVTASDTPDATLSTVLEAAGAVAVTHHDARVVTFLHGEDQVTVRAVSPPAFPFLLLGHTGSAEHLSALRTRAGARHLRLSRTGLTDVNGRGVRCRDEAEIYGRLDLPWIPPEMRQDGHEVSCVAESGLPELVDLRHIRGDLHVHTLWSDGRDPVERIVLAARALGYQYVAITDHSPTAAASRVLTIDRIERQIEEIAATQSRVPGIRILRGIEVDILPDGSLDMPDEILARLDIVLASLHEPAGQGPDRLLERYLGAVRHPLVHVITHPTNRMVGQHPGYALDYDALFAAAAETGTVLEIDGGPAHLDMDGALARRAIAAGVTVAVDSDCHNATRLQRQMLFGVGTARRGRVEPRHVINTRSVDAVLSWCRHKATRMRALSR